MSMLRKMLDAMGIEDWEVNGIGDTLICPCGWEIEQDGECPDGCKSPLLDAGMI